MLSIYRDDIKEKVATAALQQIGAGLRRDKDLLFPGDARVFETTALSRC